ncbi:class I SAM-dependent methyltransferase [bacterium]|nr:class I SAM-dependent methyltransferase [bacterium]
MKIVEKTWNEFWAYYWRVTRREKIPAIEEYDRNVIRLIEKKCGLSSSHRILDLGCGHGFHAHMLAEKGHTVVGIDIADSLINYARDHFQSNSSTLTYIRQDMREIGYCGEFDLCILLSGTFGFFSEPENRELLEKIARALIKGGRIMIMYISAFRTDLDSKTWTEIENGFQLSQTWFEHETSTYHSTTKLVLDSGEIIVPKREQGYHGNEIIRCYTPPEIGHMLTVAGFEKIVHLGRKHIADPDAFLQPGDIREIVVAQKA